MKIEMADQSPVRFGYIGCGFVGQNIHIPNFSALKECKFLALAEPRKELGTAVAKRYGIPKLYKNHEEMAADPEIEAVGVSAPFSLQGKIAEDLVRAGKHVFMEKPMAVVISRGESIVKAIAAQKNKARVMVGYMKRYDSGNLLLKKQLDAWRKSGEVGRVLYARNHGYGGNWLYAQDPNVPFEKSSDAPPPAPDDCPEWLPKSHYGTYLGYLQQWTHNVNLLRFLLDDREGTTKVKSVDLDKDGMTGVVVLEINGTRAIVESAYTKFHGWEEHTQVYFEGGWLRTEAPPLMAKETPATVEIYRSANGEAAPRLSKDFAPPGWSYREEAKHFLKCIRSGEAFHSSAEDTLHDVRLFEEIYKKYVS